MLGGQTVSQIGMRPKIWRTCEMAYRTWKKPMFKVGKTYETVGGDMVKIVGISNEDTTYETVYCEDMVHRYNRRDYGRVTGTDHETPDNRNLKKHTTGIVTSTSDDYTFREAMGLWKVLVFNGHDAEVPKPVISARLYQNEKEQKEDRIWYVEVEALIFEGE